MSGQRIPTHIGYILDGNRRWAKKHGVPTYEGHMAGMIALEEVVEATVNAGVKYVSFYTWSTENWNRAEDEVRATLGIIKKMFKRYSKKLVAENIRMVVLGDMTGVPDDIREMIEELEEKSKDCTRATLAVCFNYGGQQEIVRAAQRLMKDGVRADDVTPEVFAGYLDHPDVPACDFIVRTSGEHRLSNFMLWRSAYSEFLFLDKYWPEMRENDVTAIIEEYNRRDRRYGG